MGAPWPSEGPLRALVLVVAVLVWGALVASVVGILIAGLVALGVSLAQIVARARLVGSAVRVGPDQLSELHDEVARLAECLGIEPPPTYLVAGPLARRGAANPFARRISLLGARYLLVSPDGLDLLRTHPESGEFWLAHELAGLRAGQLDWAGFLWPGRVCPLIGSAYARACTHTRDRLACAATGNPAGAREALCGLAGGARNRAQLRAFPIVAQLRELESVPLQIGQWLAFEPAIARRLAVCDPLFAADGADTGASAESPASPRAPGRPTASRGLAAALVLLLWVGAPTGAVGLVAWQARRQWQRGPEVRAPERDPRRDVVESALASLAQAAVLHREQEGALPADVDALYEYWRRLYPAAPDPLDPYDGSAYGYQVEDEGFLLWSVGPDLESEADDLVYTSP